MVVVAPASVGTKNERTKERSEEEEETEAPATAAATTTRSCREGTEKRGEKEAVKHTVVRENKIQRTKSSERVRQTFEKGSKVYQKWILQSQGDIVFGTCTHTLDVQYASLQKEEVIECHMNKGVFALLSLYTISASLSPVSLRETTSILTNFF